MASPSFLLSQVFQTPLQSAALNSPLLIKFNHRINNDADITTIRAGKQLSFYTSNPSQNTLNLDDQHATLCTKESSQFPLKWDLKDLRLKTLANKIRALSSKNRIKILDILAKDGQLQNISDFNYLLMALVIAKQHHICITVYNKLPSYQVVPDCWTFSIMIRCYSEKNHLDEAETVLNTMLENGFHPDVATSTNLISSFCKRGRMKKALEIFELMNRIGTKPTVLTYNCLLKGLCYVGKVEQAFEMLMNMKNKKKNLWKPDIYSYTTVMDGLCKVGRSDEAMELLNEAEVVMGLTPNVITFNTLFQGYSREGRPLEGISVLKLMKKKNCVPDYVSYSTLLHGLLKWNEIKQALRIYKEMERFGFEVDVRMMGTLVRRLCRKSWKERAMLEDAYQVFEKMTRRDLTIDERTHEVMIQALCAQGRTEEAVSILVLVYAKGRIPSKFSLDVVISELNAQGRLFCASNLFGSAMKLGVIPMEEPLLYSCM